MSSTAIYGFWGAAAALLERRAQAARGAVHAWAGLQLLVLLGLLLGMSAPALATNCSDAPYFGVVDGNVHYPPPSQIQIDSDCTIRNYPAPTVLNTNFSFYTQPGGNNQRWLVVFDNVAHTGNMSCNNTHGHKIWFTNGSSTKIQESCQNLLIPVEKIEKLTRDGATTATVGVPFTYRLVIPVLYDPASGSVIVADGSRNQLHGITIEDDLTATGVDLSYLGHSVEWRGGGAVPHHFTNDGGRLRFDFDPAFTLPAGDQIIIDITVVLDESPRNLPGTEFVNVAKWAFGRVVEDQFYTPLPGEWGTSPPLTIAAPDLVVTKTGPATVGSTLNLGEFGHFRLEVHNQGLAGAWHVSVVDRLPATASNPPLTGAMCAYAPERTDQVRIVSAGGATRSLSQGSDYTWSYAGAPSCELSLTLLPAAGPLAAGERLMIDYRTRLDDDTEDGAELTNVAAAVHWGNAEDPTAGRTWGCSLTDGTPGVVDCQDAHTALAAFTGYFFEKTAHDPATGERVTQAQPGETLRYRLHLRTMDQAFGNLVFRDDLGALDAFEAGSLKIISLPPGAVDNSDIGAGVLDIGNLSVLPPTAGGTDGVLQAEFEATLRADLAEDTVVANQASLIHHGAPIAHSHDPLELGPLNAAEAQPGEAQPTEVTINLPLPAHPLKEALAASATIGEEVSFRITVPAAAEQRSLYDVRVTDRLDERLEYTDASVSGVAAWSDVSTDDEVRIAIPEIAPGEQAVIELRARVRNVASAHQGLAIENRAAYSYANSPGATARPPLASNSVSVAIVEPYLEAVSKTASTAAPTAGETLRYSVTMTAAGGSNTDAFDIGLEDTLGLGLVYVGNPSVSGAGNSIGAPLISGDGVSTPQTLVWGSAQGNAAIDIPAGGSVTIAYDVRVLDSVLAGQTLTNTVSARWTGLDGASPYQRDGSDGIDGVNDYVTEPVELTLTARDLEVDFTKRRLSDTFGPEAELRIGDLVDYELRLSIPEGTLGDLRLVDTLPQGLKFVGIVSVNGATGAPYAAVAPFAHADLAPADVTQSGDPASGPTSVSWNLGNVSNPPTDGQADDFVIVYRALVLNEVLAHRASTPLENVAELSFDTAAGPITRSGADTITVVQPVLAVSKRSQPAAGGIVDVGSTVTYTVDIHNSGSAPAYDVVLEDTLPPGMRAGGVTVLGISLDSTDLPARAPDYDAASGLASWDFDAGAYVIPPGETLRVVYRAWVDADAPAGATLTNRAQVRSYYSFAAAEPPSRGAVVGVREAYGPTEPAETRLHIAAPPSKALLTPTVAAIGAEVSYRLTVPGAPLAAALSEVVVRDTLDPALAFVAASATLGGAPLALEPTLNGQALSWNVGEIPAGEQLEITLTARVANRAETRAGASFVNSVAYSHAGSLDGWSSEPSEPVGIVEPRVTLAKLLDAEPPAAAGERVRYVLELTAAAGSDFSTAHDLVLEDVLGEGLEYVAGSSRIDGSAREPTLSGQTVTWPAFDLAPGDRVIVAYEARVRDSVSLGQPLSNTATARWTSLAGESPHERTGSGEPEWNDYVTSDSLTVYLQDGTTLAKAHVGDSWHGDGRLRVGDRVDYELRLGLQNGTHRGVVVTDTLPAGMVFEGTVSADYFGAGAGGTVAEPTVDGQRVTWTLGTVVNPADSGSDELVIVYRARVMNEGALSQEPTRQTLRNSATLAYQVGADTLQAGPAVATVSVLQPLVTVSQSPRSGEGATVAAGDSISYTVELHNSGLAPAYDPVLEAVLPVGLRAGGVETESVQLVNAGTSLAPLAPGYDPATGRVVWNFDTGIAGQYTIPAGETLRVRYRVEADADLGAGRELINRVRVTHYYSFDNDAVPANGQAEQRQLYGPTAEAASRLHTGLAGALAKATTQPSAAIGERFSYLVTVPETPLPLALHGVEIVDDLAASAADLRFIAASLDGVPLVNSGTDTRVVLGADGGIDVPANGQVQIEITVELLDTATNLTPGLSFVNSAWYSYGNGETRLGTEPETTGTSEPMTVAHPLLVVTKSGPATLKVGVPAVFVVEAENVGDSAAWNVRLSDRLPNPIPGGMCEVAPSVESVTVHEASGAIVTLAPEDYAVTFTPGEPSCELTLALTSATAAVAPGDRLRLAYRVTLDPDNIHASTLTNVAGATEWFSGPASLPERHRYRAALTDGTPGVADHQDAHAVVVEAAILQAQKQVFNVTSGASGERASPGDTLRYSIRIDNTSDVPLAGFSLLDELDALNAQALFVPGSLSVISLPAGASAAGSDAAGGGKGSGLLRVDDLAIDAYGSLEVVFEATLVPVIDSGTLVLNQGRLALAGTVFALTDDPAVTGEQEPTRTLIRSAPAFQVHKVSQDLTGDPDVLLAGDVLRYTLTIKNVGDENAVDVSLRDLVPDHTTYLPGSTTLNGAPVPDPAPGVSPLQAGMLVHAPEDPTPGALRADASETSANVATVTFDVRIDLNVVDGTVISNQGFVNGAGAGDSGQTSEQPSDDPRTPVADDPTRDIVGNLPLLGAHKTVQILVDDGTPGVVDPGDVLRYTIRIDNFGNIPATAVRLVDLVPEHTTYLTDTLRLNGVPVGQPDRGILPLIAGIAVHSPDQAAGSGIVAAGEAAIVTFAVQVDADVAAGTLIVNQGRVESRELPTELTDADGDPSNGHQPTVVVVGQAQQLAIAKDVRVVEGGVAEAGKTLEYLVTVTNIGNMPALEVVITDDLAPLAGQASYVEGSARLKGASHGISFQGSVLSADYAGVYGPLAPGEAAVLRFRVRLDAGLPIGTRIGNTAVVSWNTPPQTAAAQAVVDVGGITGSGIVNGRAWHDADFDKLLSDGERPLAGWTVEIYRNAQRIGTILTDEEGAYSFSGLAPNDANDDAYELRFLAPGAGPNTAPLGHGDSEFTNGPQQILDIRVGSGSNLQNLNLPIDPNGVVYDSVHRRAVAGATLTMLNAASQTALPSSCFDDPAQQGQVTGSGGHYKFDLNFASSACPAGGSYLIQVAAPGSGFTAAPSRIIPPQTAATTEPFAVPGCAGSGRDAVLATAQHCEAQPSAAAPATAIAARTAGTHYYLHLTLGNGHLPGDSQLFNNHIAIDPELDDAVAIAKTAGLVNVSRGQLVPYTITLSNTLGVALYELRIVDTLPAGFKYVAGSARIDGRRLEPAVDGRVLSWDLPDLAPEAQHSLQLLAIVGAGVTEGNYINRAQMFSAASGEAMSGEATAGVRVVPDPTFDCTDIIGKVFDDANRNGIQDPGERGIGGVRIVSARGLIATTDPHGRFHIACAAVPDEDRGSNFILKLDDRTLPAGYRVTSENPLVQRATRGKMMRFNFGASLHRVVGLSLADEVFEPATVELRQQWVQRLDLLMEELQKSPSILRISYLADVEDAALVRRRVDAMQREISERWEQLECCQSLTIETETFWRRGGPPPRRRNPLTAPAAFSSR